MTIRLALNPMQTTCTDSRRSENVNLLLAALAELIGTFLLVLVGTAVATAAVQGKARERPDRPTTRWRSDSRSA